MKKEKMDIFEQEYLNQLLAIEQQLNEVRFANRDGSNEKRLEAIKKNKKSIIHKLALYRINNQKEGKEENEKYQGR